MAENVAPLERTTSAERRATLMGTEAHVIVVGDDAAHLADIAIARLRRLEALWSRFLPDSEISRLNNSPGVPVLVTPETFRLIDHALTYTQPGGRVIVRSERQGDQASVTVSDNGVGIAAADLPLVFERFFRAPGLERPPGGSGIGLTVAAGIARAHHGDIRADSSGLGDGATFTLELPADAR